jgi:serine protease Do
MMRQVFTALSARIAGKLFVRQAPVPMKSSKLCALSLVASNLLLLTSAASFGNDQVKDASANLQLARQLNQAFIEVAEKLSPAVVIITVVQKPGTAVAEDDESNALDALPPELRKHLRRQREEQTHGQGSGVLVREDGYIITNGHVVEDAETIEVRLQDGRNFKAKLRGQDPQSDIAVIKIDAKGLPVARLADSNQTRVGEFAIAIGAPFSLDYSVTFGHVSAKGRSNILPLFAATAMMDQDFIQTDANINPGNSGGPLVNIEGEVIGINTLIRGLHTGIGFAIPSSLVKEISDQLISEGKFTRAWLGIGIRALRDATEVRRQISGVDDGVIVSEILDQGPAHGSQLRRNDVITAVDGKHVSTPQQLRGEVRGKKIGQPITLDVFRPDSEGAGKALQIQVKPGEWQEPEPVPVTVRREPASEAETNILGVAVHALTQEMADRFGVELVPGVIVVSTEKGKPAARQGIKPGDVITSLDQHPVANTKQFREVLKKVNLKKGVKVNVVTGEKARFEILKEGRE